MLVADEKLTTQEINTMTESELRSNLLDRFRDEQQDDSQCPVMKPPVQGGGNRDWWPNQPNLKVLQHNPDVINPMGPDYDYAEEVKTLDVDSLRADIVEVMKTSQDWWPADFGHYGPFFIRMKNGP